MFNQPGVWVVALALLAAVALIALRFWNLRTSEGMDIKLSDGLLGAVGWDFTKSWASTFTGIAALLGTFLGLRIDVEVEMLGTNTQFALLNLFFGALILFAALVFQATGRWIGDGFGATATRQFRGTVFWFLASSGLTMWAVFGQLLLVLIAVYDVTTQGLVAGLIGGTFMLLLAAALVLVFVHAWRTLAETIRTQIDKPAMNELESQGAAVPPRWTML